MVQCVIMRLILTERDNVYLTKVQGLYKLVCSFKVVSCFMKCMFATEYYIIHHRAKTADVGVHMHGILIRNSASNFASLFANC